MSVERQAYLDASALVKLIVNETESAALRAYLVARPSRVSCALAQVEVVRAVRPEGTDAVKRARTTLSDIAVLALDQPLLRAAADLHHQELRSLDAIHVAAAASLGSQLSELITYDRRMARAAESLGLTVSAPA